MKEVWLKRKLDQLDGLKDQLKIWHDEMINMRSGHHVQGNTVDDTSNVIARIERNIDELETLLKSEAPHA